MSKTAFGSLIIAILVQICPVNKAESQALYAYQGRIHVTTWITTIDHLDSIENPFISRTLFLYKQYLIEPEIHTRLYNGGSPEYDTVGYYFIDLKNQIYLKYSDLSKDAKLLEEGPLSDKVPGLIFYYPENDLFRGVSNLSVKDTVIDNEHCKIALAERIVNKSRCLIKGWIYPSPNLFPVQYSVFLSNKVGGGFVREMSITSMEGKRAVVGKIIIEDDKLPKNIIDLMEHWKQITCTTN